MAIESEVLVIGGGLGGLTSALAAAREGADVRLVSYKQSTLRQASGLVDVLGYTPDGDGPLTDPYEAIPSLPEAHPYRKVGVQTVRDALSLFDDAVPTYEGEHTDTNALLPTHGGSIKPTARYPAGASAGLASDTRDTLLVGIEEMVDFDAPHVAAHLDATGVPFDVRGETIRFPGDLRADAKVTRYAKLLDTNSEVAVRGRMVPAREALAQRVNPLLEDEERVGFPAILGDDNPGAIRDALGDHLGVDVFEVPMGPPSLPGLRLEDTLFSALDEAGASIETGNPVVDFDGEDRIEKVFIEKNGAKIPNSADQYVLATGGFVGKGVESDREGVYEPVFDCHIPHAADRYDWFEGELFGDHEFARYGVATDDDLRPLDASEHSEFENLRAAGSVLGGYDFAAEKSGSGVSIATGYAAGQRAAQEAR
ncbi:glycerol-3-phosphate dehydrogenase subunit GlpB [Haloarcula marismortui]|uniref:Anaerobic glycerol-3-phosphate dehydrogenase subunit B n=1 Tax=Haloarcula marismortui ATCC 33800 TaxID=662476 RepID=M0JXU3_9EURY|nr:glycerol-3-phosphate dehydrogenase subunit GlpB [Haloarcula sinaiiensis]EMA13801.1 anaerobic glycerol-3-phosphate dehydrogenase subunit B [Haloarcula sinaiiensis ATCC 33800]QUJ73522.1 glycerol-3-phosphate dehydrogenase subunit GlpB [Haloarcula sinaiiensis ATCC 33800]